MQKDISNKIRLLLNELAILNQPDTIQGKYFFNVETLLRLKQLSGELYLLSDMAADGSFNSSMEKEDTAPKTTQTEVPEVTISAIPEKVEEIAVVDEISDFNLSPQEIATPLTAKVEPEPEKEIPKPVEEPKAEIAFSEKKPGDESKLFEGKISFTRRFEYVNGLFGGDSNALAEFLQDISNAGNLEEAIHLFQKKYEEKNWKRKAETADDLKQLIKKVK